MKRMFAPATAGLALAVGLFAAAGSANAGLITFTDDPLGTKPNAYSPVDHPLVQLFDTNGEQLYISMWGSQAIDLKALRVRTNTDGSKLEMRFAFDINTISLWFGNDEEGRTADGDLAYLEAYNDTTLIGTTSMPLNRNNALDQQISYFHTTQVFNRVLFSFTDPNFSPFTGPGAGGSMGMQENVDNISYEYIQYVVTSTLPPQTNSPSSVPEPGTLLVIAGALLGLAAGRRRRA